MRVELTPKVQLDTEVKKYMSYKKIPFKTGPLNIENAVFVVMDRNESTIGYDEYKEQFDLFYRNLENKTKGKEYQSGDKKEINDNINAINRLTTEEIMRRGMAFNCSLRIDDHICYYEDELRKHFESGKPKSYLPFLMGIKLDIELTCSDTRYQPIKLGELLTE